MRPDCANTTTVACATITAAHSDATIATATNTDAQARTNTGTVSLAYTTPITYPACTNTMQ
jgi:hypothetical protein